MCFPKGHFPLIIHVLDDILFIGPPKSGICNKSLEVFNLGVSLLEEKTIMAVT